MFLLKILYIYERNYVIYNLFLKYFNLNNQFKLNMKHRNKILSSSLRILLVMVFLGGIFASCSKDDKETEIDGVNRADFAREYFNIQDGDFNGRALPNSNTSLLEILGINGNSTVLAGGSNIIHVTASDNSSQVIVGVRGASGYFTIPLERDSSSGVTSMEIDLQLLIGQQAEGDFSIAFSATDGQGNYGPFEYLDVALMEAGTGVLQISLSWDQENDVDLHVIEPNGYHIYFGDRNSLNGGQLDVDSNAACSIDNINNENIYYEDDDSVTIEYGEYEVLVDLWSVCQITEDTNYTIIVYYGGEVIATTEGINPHSGILTPEDESHNSNLISVMKFTIDSAPAPRTINDRKVQAMPKVFNLNYEKNNKVFENFGSKKQ